MLNENDIMEDLGKKEKMQFRKLCFNLADALRIPCLLLRDS